MPFHLLNCGYSSNKIWLSGILEWNQDNSITRSIIPDSGGIMVYSVSESRKAWFFHQSVEQSLLSY